MSQRKPWGVNRISDMVSAHVRTQRSGKWVRAVPAPYHKNIRERVRAAWWVLTGRGVEEYHTAEIRTVEQAHEVQLLIVQNNGNLSFVDST